MVGAGSTVYREGSSALVRPLRAWGVCEGWRGAGCMLASLPFNFTVLIAAGFYWIVLASYAARAEQKLTGWRVVAATLAAAHSKLGHGHVFQALRKVRRPLDRHDYPLPALP